MSIEIIKKESKGYVRGVTLGFVKIQNPVLKYQSKTDKEYSVDLIVSEDVADEWEELFPKNGVRKIKTEDFESIYKCPPPFPKEKKQFVLKVRTDALFKGDVGEYKEGDLVPYSFTSRPKVYIPSPSGKVEDVTMEKLVGNGSVGDVSFRIMSNDYGDFPKLSAVLVKELVKYEAKGSSSDFGEVEHKEPSHKEEAPVEKKSEKNPPVEETFDSDEGEESDPFDENDPF